MSRKKLHRKRLCDYTLPEQKANGIWRWLHEKDSFLQMAQGTKGNLTGWLRKHHMVDQFELGFVIMSKWTEGREPGWVDHQWGTGKHQPYKPFEEALPDLPAEQFLDP